MTRCAPRVLMAVLVFALPAVLAAQRKQCGLPLDKAPAVASLKLGMTPDAVAKALGVPTIRVQPLPVFSGDSGVESSQLRRSEQTIPKGLANVVSLRVDLLDRVVVKVFVLYEGPGFKFARPVQLARHAGKMLGLGAFRWQHREEADGNSAALHCNTFTISANSGGNDLALMLVDETADLEIRQRLTKPLTKETP